MLDDHGNYDLNDILYDAECLRLSEAREATFFAVTGRVLRAGESSGGDAPPGAETGQALIAQCPEQTRVRYETLLYAEATFPPTGEHGYLIGPACQILERELDRLVATPARAIAAHLIAALDVTGQNPKQVDLLKDWACGKVPTTLGIDSVLLLGLRRAVEQDRAAVREFLAACFRSRYQELLASKGLGKCLDRIREEFRNPTSHGKATFNRTRYEQFVGLVAGNLRFGTWDIRGPDPAAPDPAVAVLHHHLSQSRETVAGAPRTAEPITRLLALQTPAASPLQIYLEVQRAEGLTTSRDVTPAVFVPDPSFRLGERIRFAFRTSRRCHLTLIDIGTSGAVAVIWPNSWHGETLVEGEKAYFLPHFELPEFEFRLSGLPGTERVLAVATLMPLSVPLQPRPGAAFRELSAPEILALADEVACRNPATWAVGQCEFTVEK
jgi:hypothetical protein